MKIGKLGISQRRAMWELSIEDGITIQELNHRACWRYGRRINFGITGAALPELERRGLVVRTEASTGYGRDAVVHLSEDLRDEQRAAFRAAAIETAGRFRAELVQEVRSSVVQIQATADLLSSRIAGLADDCRPLGTDERPLVRGTRLAHMTAGVQAISAATHTIDLIESLDSLPAGDEVASFGLLLDAADPDDPSF